MRRFDVPLVVTTLVLLCLGLVVMGSASWFVSSEEYGDPFHFLKRQGFAVMLGVVAMTALAFTPYRKLMAWAPALYGFSIAGLVAVWVPGIGHAANGAQRWFGVGGIHFQPAEMAKVAALICLATWLHRNRGAIHDPRVLGYAAAGAAPVLGLIIVQPDFGSTAIITGLCGLMVFLAGIRWAWFFAMAGAGISALAVVLMAESYRMARLVSFMDPCENSSTTGYQVCQSLVSIHHGGLFGQGLGEGKGKLLFLPEPYNDFIGAVLGEELGLVGMVCLFALYGLFAWRGISIAEKAKDPFGVLLGTTFTIMLVGQACLNLGVTMAIVPPKGLVLPFMSYGATAMIVNLAAVGVLLSISADAGEETASEAQNSATKDPASARAAGRVEAVGVT